jgi:ribosome-associated protein
MNSTELQQLARNAVDEMKGADIVVLDVAERTSVTDWMIVVTGTSQRHVKSLANEVIEKSKEAGVRPIGTEGETDGNWILVDLGDVVVHVMTRESRDFYALEKLWGMVASERGDSDTEDSLAEDAEGAPVNQQQVQ